MRHRQLRVSFARGTEDRDVEIPGVADFCKGIENPGGAFGDQDVGDAALGITAGVVVECREERVELRGLLVEPRVNAIDPSTHLGRVVRQRGLAG